MNKLRSSYFLDVGGIYAQGDVIQDEFGSFSRVSDTNINCMSIKYANKNTDADADLFVELLEPRYSTVRQPVDDNFPVLVRGSDGKMIKDMAGNISWPRTLGVWMPDIGALIALQERHDNIISEEKNKDDKSDDKVLIARLTKCLEEVNSDNREMRREIKSLKSQLETEKILLDIMRNR